MKTDPLKEFERGQVEVVVDDNGKLLEPITDSRTWSVYVINFYSEKEFSSDVISVVNNPVLILTRINRVCYPDLLIH